MIVEDELVGREEHVTVAAANTLGSRTTATSRHAMCRTFTAKALQ